MNSLRLTSILALVCALVAPAAAAQPLVIVHVTVIDATDRPPQPDMTVGIDGDRIASIRPAKSARIAPHAQVVDGTGKFLIPGLWDMHVHGAADQRATWSYPLYLANGILGVRDMFGPPDARAWRARQADLHALAPRVFLASPIVDGPNPRWPTSIVVADEASARQAVIEQQQRGADFIKVYSRLPADAFFGLADEARKRGIPFAGHVPESVTAAEASSAGQKSIEHLTGVIEGCSRDLTAVLSELRMVRAALRSQTASLPERMTNGQRVLALEARLRATYDEPTAQELFKGFVAHGTWQCPTLTVLRAQMEIPAQLHDPRMRYLSSGARANWEGGFYKGLPPQVRTALIESSSAAYDEYVKIVGGMHRAGVKLLAGTDAMNPGCLPGFGLHDELARLVDAGLSPLAALQTSTRNAAEFMGQIDRRGTIEMGKVADLVLLDKDPLADIHNTREIRAVILNGELIPRERLDAMLAGAEALGAR